MEIDKLRDGVKVKCRLGRPGDEDVIWGDWEERTLKVQTDKKGNPAIISVRPDWAEYTPGDYDPDYNVWLCEDYYRKMKEA